MPDPPPLLLLLASAAAAAAAMALASPASAFSIGGGRLTAGGGGRAPGQPDMPSLDSDSDSDSDDAPEAAASNPSRARLTVVHVTDVYTLANFPHLKTLIADKRSRAEVSGGCSVISVLTGDFLAPYLLSSVDRGAGMMNALAKTPVDYLTWGNHEADVDHRTVCRHVRNFPGKWLNTNMQDHDAMEAQDPYDVMEIRSADGTNVRRVGLVAVLSDDPALYAQFKSPGAFGGATIRDPWDTLSEYKSMLENDEDCDVVLPLQHTYVPDDHRTCRQFDFPVVLSGHDHHRVDEVVDGTRLLKPGLDAVYATVLDLTWDGASSPRSPEVRASFARCDEWEADAELEEECDRAYDALGPLRSTELARVPPTFEPLSSVNSRGVVCTMGRFLCSLLRSSMNASRRQRDHNIDAVLLMGGNVRGGTDYPVGSFFSLEALEAEIKPDETLGVVPMPGWLLSDGVGATHAGDPIPGWVQYDDGVREVYPHDGGGAPVVTHVGGEEIDRERIYRVATKVGDLTNGQSPPWTEYYTSHPDAIPPKGAYVNVQAELMSFFARNVWRKIWEAVSPSRRAAEAGEGDEDGSDAEGLDELCDIENCDPGGRLRALDADGDGVLTVDDIHVALKSVLSLSVDDDERSLARFVHAFADTTGDGAVTLRDMETFCDEMPAFYENQRWRLAHPRTKRRPAEEGIGSAAMTAATAEAEKGGTRN